MSSQRVRSRRQWHADGRRRVPIFVVGPRPLARGHTRATNIDRTAAVDLHGVGRVAGACWIQPRPQPVRPIRRNGHRHRVGARSDVRCRARARRGRPDVGQRLPIGCVHATTWPEPRNHRRRVRHRDAEAVCVLVVGDLPAIRVAGAAGTVADLPRMRARLPVAGQRRPHAGGQVLVVVGCGVLVGIGDALLLLAVQINALQAGSLGGVHRGSQAHHRVRHVTTGFLGHAGEVREAGRHRASGLVRSETQPEAGESRRIAVEAARRSDRLTVSAVIGTEIDVGRHSTPATSPHLS